MVSAPETVADSSIDAPAPPPGGSISFVVVTENGVRRAGAVLDVIGEARHDGDEVILLTRSDRVAEFPQPAKPWLRIIGIADANIFTLRSRIPAIARRQWVVLLEEHALVTRATLVAIRDMIEGRQGIDLIAFLGKNLTSVSAWGWANFLQTFALLWAPLDHPPPFSLVTSVAVRRAALGPETPLKEGEWELRLIPRIFSRGRVGYSNEIYIDHVKPLDFASCFAVNFHNGRTSAANRRRLGTLTRGVISAGVSRYWGPRPGKLARALYRRRRELPRGTFLRLWVVELAFLLGAVIGALFGPGQSAHKLD